MFSGFSMVNGSEVRIACPSISFLFARLGGSLGVFPYLENKWWRTGGAAETMLEFYTDDAQCSSCHEHEHQLHRS